MMDTKEDKKEALGSRFNWWFVLTGFSVVVLSAVVSDTKNENDRTRTQQWAVAVSSVSLSLAALACIAHALARDRFVGTPIEGGLAVLCLGFWAAGLPSIMNPNTHIALADYLQSSDSPEFTYALNANVYFFTWGSFIASLFLMGSFAQEAMRVQWPDRAFKRSIWWLGLGATSLVVMASGSRTFHLANCQRDHAAFYNDSCERVKLGVSLGATGAALAVLMGLVSHLKPLLMESFVGVVVIIMWCFGVSYITFGNKAPAPGVGNLYFSTWAAFTFSLFVGADAIAEFYCKMFCGNEQPTSTPAKGTVATSEPEMERTTEESPSDPATTEPSNV